MLRSLFCLFGLLLAPVADASQIARTILGLHDAPLKGEPDANYLYSLAETPLNHLGLKLEYSNLRESVPTLENRRDIRGILIWLSDGRGLPVNELIALMIQANARHIPIVLVGSIPNTSDNKGRPITLGTQNELLAHLELQTQGTFLPYTFDLKTVTKDTSMVEFERKLPNPPPATEAIEPTTDGATSFLAFERTGTEGEKIHTVLLTRSGGYIASGFSHFESKNGAFLQWYVNPFAYFAQAFKTGQLPIPDTTTLNGQRIFYSHIDGDGWGNVSTVDKYARLGIYASEVILKEVVEAYPDLPVTVAPIAADLDPAWVGSLKSQQIARELFSKANVEPASHTYTHPFEWKFFGLNYKPESEIPFLKKYAKFHLGKGVSAQYKGPKGSLNHQYDAPRAFGDIPFSHTREIQGSAAYINTFCPPGKRVRLIQWSGDTSPTEDVLASTFNAGLLNLNARDTRFDGDHASYAAVSPLGKRSGKFMQVSASHANENVYTDLWQGRFFGFKYLTTSLINTEKPIRIKPVNIYYHMYSGEREASLAALKSVLDYASKQPLAPITATQFAAIGQGFYSIHFDSIANDAWRITNRGALNTLRFDDPKKLRVDFDKSTGVLGQTFNGRVMFVSLDPAVPVVELHLSERPSTRTSRPILITSRWVIRNLKTNSTSAQFYAEGFGTGTMTWQVPTSNKNERWEAVVENSTFFSSAQDTNGNVTFQLPRKNENGKNIRLQRSTLRSTIQ